MNEVPLNDWARFEAAVSRTLDSFESRRGNSRGISHPLFRGQADAEWKLRTTLERFARQARAHKPWTISEYYSLVRRVLPTVESLTGKVWPFPEDLELGVNNFNDGEVPPPRVSEFMIYLRHHGFPSPLLDWSRSPYVAAFFAFERQPHDGCEAVAVYSFQEQIGYGKSDDSDKARIIGLQSTTAPTHERHYSQQCEYTFCKAPYPCSAPHFDCSPWGRKMRREAPWASTGGRQTADASSARSSSGQRSSGS